MKEINIDDYVNLRFRFKDFVYTSKLDSISIYEFGEIKHPGISDYDLLIIGDINEIYLIQKFYHDLILLDSRYRYIMFHQPVFCPSDMIKDLFNFHTLYNVKCIIGSDILQSNLSKSFKQLEYNWATSLLSIIVEVLNSDWSLRDKLLLQKNIVTSLFNLCETNYFDLVEKHRKDFLHGRLTHSSLDNSLDLFISIMCEKLITSELTFQIKFKKIRVNNNVIFYRKNDSNSYGRNKNCLVVNDNLFSSLQKTIMTHPIFNAQMRLFLKFNNKLDELNLPRFSPTPFGLRFYGKPYFAIPYSVL